MERKLVAGLMLALLQASMLSMASLTPVKAQYAADSHTVALWDFDEAYTSDTTGNNVGVLGAHLLLFPRLLRARLARL